jgi:hypothetical protein
VIQKHAKDEASDVALHLRLLRELDLRKRDLVASFENFSTVSTDHAIINSLHVRVATLVSRSPLEKYSEWTRILRYTPTSLWDGTPALPVQPSTGTFQFLTELQKQMSASGTDLWAPKAVRTLKVFLNQQLVERNVFEAKTGDQASATGDANDLDGEAKDSSAAPSDNDAKVREQHIQMAFDALYLQRATQTVDGNEDRLATVVDQLLQHVELEQPAQDRLKKNAHEYWRRTFLLFGLLSG